MSQQYKRRELGQEKSLVRPTRAESLAAEAMAAINQELLALGRFDQDGLASPDHGPIRLMTERAV